MKRLLINADDLGYDADTLATTTALMDVGAVRSATILVGWPETDAAIRYARAHPEHSFGLHFNIAEGRPLSPRPVRSLVDAGEQFRGPIHQRLRAIAGLLDPADLQAELEAQLGILADHGLAPSHLDSHGHFHKFPRVIAALRPVLARFGIAKVRIAQTRYDNPRFYNAWLDRLCTRAIRPDLTTTEAFFNTRRYDDGWFDRLVDTLGDGTTELGVHPGRAEEWRRVEAMPLSRPAFADALRARGVEIVSYHQLERAA